MGKFYVIAPRGWAKERVDFTPNLQAILSAAATGAGASSLVGGVSAGVGLVVGGLIGSISSIINRGEKGNDIIREVYLRTLQEIAPNIPTRTNAAWEGFDVLAQLNEKAVREVVESVKRQLVDQASKLRSSEARREFGNAVKGIEIISRTPNVNTESHIFNFETYEPPPTVPVTEINAPVKPAVIRTSPTQTGYTPIIKDTSHVYIKPSTGVSQSVQGVQRSESVQLQWGLLAAVGILAVAWVSR